MKHLRVLGVRIILVLMVSTAILMVFTEWPVDAQQNNKQSDKKQPETATVNGDHWKGQGEKGEQVWTITGNVVVKYGDVTITSDKAVYTEKTKIVVMEGNLKITDPENEITGPKGTTYLNERKCVIDGGVKLVAKPKSSNQQSENDPETIREHLTQPTTMTCDKVEYLYRKKIATAEGNIKVVQKDRVGIAKKAVYDVNEEHLTLTGGVFVKDEKGQTFSSEGTVRMSLKEGSEWIEAENGSATVKVDLEEEIEGDDTTETPAEKEEKQE